MHQYAEDPAPYRRALPAQVLGPPEAYAGYADRPTRPEAHPTTTVARVVATRCAGYATRPTPEEVCESLSSADKARGCPFPAQVWLSEATLPEIMDSWLEGAYPLDALAAALHDHALRREDAELLAWLNHFRVDRNAEHD